MTPSRQGILRRLAARVDGYFNPWSGIGSSNDRTVGGSFLQGMPIPDPTLTALYAENDLAAKIVNLLPNECQRGGYTLRGPNAAALRALCEPLGVDHYLHEGHVWGRLYGGAVTFAVTDDATDTWKPRDINAPGRTVALETWDRRRVSVATYYQNIRSPNYGRPEVYIVQPIAGYSASQPIYVHESRLVIFGGEKTDQETRLQLAGWDYSVLQRVYRELLAFAEADGAVNVMLSEASQGVFTYPGLIEALGSHLSGAVQARLAAMNAGKSVVNALVLDKDETFTRTPVPFGGIADILEKKQQRLAAAAGVPPSLLFGAAGGGLNTSTDSEFQVYYENTASYRTTYLEPRLRRLLTIIAPDLGRDVEIEWGPLDSPSAKESADTRLVQAQADAIYLDREVLSPEECAASRFPEAGWSAETHVRGPRPTAPALPSAPAAGALPAHGTPPGTAPAA